MSSEQSWEEWKKGADKLRVIHPAFEDQPGRRVFSIIDGNGPDGSDTHIGQLIVVR